MKQRIVYIDNLKALAIFTVVMGHVFFFTWNHYSDSVWNHLIVAYNMPMFFFLSGMFAKNNMTLAHLARKAKQLLIPVVSLGGLYAFLNDGFGELFFGGSHFGYWFLPTLFVMFAIFYIRCLMVAFIHRLCNVGVKGAVFLDVTYMLGIWGCTKALCNFMPESMYNLFCLGQIANYVLFFWLGFLAKEHKAIISSLLHKHLDLIYAVSFLCFFFLFYLLFYSGYESRGLIWKVMALFSIPMLMILFKKSDFGEGRIQKMISYVGMHSLEIYVLQYFFLPLSYKLDDTVVGGVNCLALSLIESVLTVALCVVAIKMIDINKYLNLIFFGK